MSYDLLTVQASTLCLYMSLQHHKEPNLDSNKCLQTVAGSEYCVGRLGGRPARLDDGGDELDQEAGHTQQGGIEVVQEVHDEALDVAAVVVLVRHDHQVPIPQLLHI